MKTKLFFTEQQGLDNLVFESRNKQYGAYELRTHYEDRLSAALVASLSFFMLVFSVYYYFNRPVEIPFTITCGGPCKPPKPLKDVLVIEYPPEIYSEPAATGTVVPKLTKDHIKDNGKILPFTGGDGTGKGNPDATGSGLQFGVDDGFTPIEPPVNPEKKPVDYEVFPDIIPEFYGGQSTYEKYLQQHVKYPEMAVVNGIQGTIFVSVKIDETGRVVGVELVKGIGAGCDEEAMRVIKNMPAWKPGKMNGRPVPVKCILKVRMLLQ